MNINTDLIHVYLIITAAGSWGKGRTMAEAATNAGIRGQWSTCKIFCAPYGVVSEIWCTDSGSAHYSWGHLIRDLGDTEEQAELWRIIRRYAVEPDPNCTTKARLRGRDVEVLHKYAPPKAY